MDFYAADMIFHAAGMLSCIASITYYVTGMISYAVGIIFCVAGMPYHAAGTVLDGFCCRGHGSGCFFLCRGHDVG